jgi:hypothetical protein
MSDVGLVPVHVEDHKANYYLLPIGRDLVLEGVFYYDGSKNSSSPVLRGMELTPDEASYRFDCICASAITEIICARELPYVSESRNRAEENGTMFCRIRDPQANASAGLCNVGEGDFRFRIVSVDEYVKLIHSHMLPRK